nr:immunoglobulin light chain junction region [Macaca mulatta]MOV36918.1 immunoglobulin light chain junction region [Macaca mulatta]MOV36928.1 immunoglobulin light chain junction region [Macaca mulatta]MOV36933.1 immunoglobulin light chain junction region [Macaca mulatta]MOV36951.1 immunoglobulin light chain junction region [Macaca mulatta]
CQKYSYSPFTF